MLAPTVVAPSKDACPSSSNTTGSTSNSPGCTDHKIDLKVTNEELNVLDWSLRRSEVPDALARRGITLEEWKAVFDKCDRLWRKRSRELQEINDERDRYWLRNPATGLILTSVWSILALVLFMWGMVMLAIMSGWAVYLVICSFLARSDYMVYFPKYFDAMAAYEKDWSQLADEQRHVFQSHADVNLEQLQEAVVVHGRKPTWTVGLRFRFEDSMTNARNWTDTTWNYTAVHNLERLLELNQNGSTGTLEQEAEYQRLKTRLVRKLSEHPNAPDGPPVVTAMAMVVADNENNNHHKGNDEKKRLLEMV